MEQKTTEEKTRHAYLIFVVGNPPNQIFSTQNIVKVWLDQLEERKKSGDWITPILFHDDDDPSLVTAACMPDKIIAVWMGAIAPERNAL